MKKINKKPLTRKKTLWLSLLYFNISIITLAIMLTLGLVLNISFSNKTVDMIFSLFSIFIGGGISIFFFIKGALMKYKWDSFCQKETQEIIKKIIEKRKEV